MRTKTAKTSAATPVANAGSRFPLMATVASVGWVGIAGATASMLAGSVPAAVAQAAAGGFGSLAGTVAGVTVPLLLIWNWGGPRRTTGVQTSATGHAGATVTDGQISDRQIGVLEEQMARVAETYGELENRFAHQSHQLGELCSQLTGRIDDITRALDDQAHRLHSGEQRVLGLTGSLSTVSGEAQTVAQQITDTLEKPMVLASGRMETVAGNIRSHVEDLWTQLQNLESAYGATREMAESARSALHKEVGDIHHVSGMAGKELAALSDSLRPQIDMIESMGRRAAERSADMQQHIDAQAVALEQVGENLKAQGQSLTGAVQEQANQLDSLKETVESLGSTLSTQFRKQVDSLLETSEMAGEQVIAQAEKGTRHLEERLTEHSVKLEMITGQVNESVEDVCEKIDSQMAKMRGSVEKLDSDMTDATERATGALNKELITMVDAIESRVSLIEDKAAEINSGIASAGDDLDHQLMMTRERIAEATRESFDEMKAQTGALVTRMRDALSEKSAGVGETISLHIEALTRASDDIENVLVAQQKGFSDDLEKRLALTSATFAAKLAEMQQATSEVDGQLAESTRGTIEAITQKIDTVTSQIDAKLSAVTDGADSLQTKLDTSLTLIEARSEEIYEGITQRSNASLADLADQESAVRQKLQILTERSDGDIQRALELKMADLKALTNSLASQVDENLSKMSDDVVARIATLTAETDKVANQVGGALAKVSGDVASRMELLADGTDRLSGQVAANLDKVSEDVTGRISTLTGDVNARFGALGDETELLETKLGTTLTLIEARSEELFGTIKGNITSATESMTAEGISAQEALEARSKELTAQLSLDVAGKLDALSENARGLKGEVDGALGLITSRVDELSDRLSQENGELIGALDKGAETMLTKFIERLERARASSQKELEALTSSIDDTAEHFDKALSARAEKSISQFGTAVDAFGEKLEGRSAASLKTFELQQLRLDSVATGIEAKVADATEQAFQRLTGLVASYQSDIAEVADGALVNMVNVGRELPDIAERLGQSIDLALEKAASIDGAYEARTEELTRLSGELLGFSDNIRNELTALPEQTQAAMNLIAEQTGTTRDLLTSQHIEIEQAMGGSQERVDLYRQSLDAKLVEFNQLFEELQRYSHNIEAVVDEQVRSITSSTDHAKRAWLDARGAMEEQTAAANEIADGYIDRMAELSKRARAEVGDLKDMSEAAVNAVQISSDAVGQQLSGFGATLGGLRELIDQVGGAAERHNEAVSATTEEAERRTHLLVEQLNETQKTRFFKSASDMVAQLNQLAVDVDAILDGELSADVVKAYRDGDRGISVRRLLTKRREPQTDLRIVDAYRNNPGFSAKVDSYLAMFEQLLSQAKASDATRMVHTAFLTGDLGKLYVFLSQALGQTLGQPFAANPQSAGRIANDRAA